MPSTELLKTLRNALLAEQEKRMKQRGLTPGLAAREQLYSKLDQMKANRERLGNPYPEPTAADLTDLIAYLITRAEAAVKG